MVVLFMFAYDPKKKKFLAIFCQKKHVFEDKQTIYYNNKLPTTTTPGVKGERGKERKGGLGGGVGFRSDLTMNDSVHGKEGFLGDD
jgi:hypothetical protein